MKTYLLYHTYEQTDDYGTHDEEKLLGVYSTYEKAKESINQFKDLEGFRDYPLDSFFIEKMEVDGPNRSWTEGFVTVRYSE